MQRADGKKAVMISLGRRQDAAVERARRRGAARCSPTPRRATSSSPELRGGAADARDAGAPLAASRRRRRCWSSSSDSREGQHLFLYPFAGRNAHIGLGSLLAWRLAKHAPNTFSIVINDYGLELLSRAAGRPDAAASTRACSSEGDLLHDVLASLNSSELARRRFREIARVAGLISQGYPGPAEERPPAAGVEPLFYEVFRKYDAGNLLLGQAESEVLSQELDITPAARGAAAHARADASTSSSWRCRARSRCR